VRAAAELARARSGVLLHLFGEGPDRAALEAEAARLGASGVVRFRGETEAPLERMREMDIVLIPSLFESFGYAAIEAFSLSRPVVAARTGGLPEIISDGEDGLLAEPGSGEALAAALRRLMDEDGLAARLAAKGRRKAAADFSLERMLAGIAGVYGEVAA
jgi:glycosyltransferase involved in cell wall biosynthesis